MTIAIREMQSALSFLKGAAWVVMGILGVGLAIVAGWLGKTILQFNLWKRPKLPKTDAYRMNASEFDAMMRRALGAARRSNRLMVKK